MSPDPKIDLTDTVEVVLAQKTWKVPVPSLRYAMRLIDLGNKISGFAGANWGEQEYQIASEAVWQGLRMAYPDLTLDAFLDMPILPEEIISAVPVVLAQTRAFRPLKPGEQSGEASATA